MTQIFAPNFSIKSATYISYSLMGLILVGFFAPRFFAYIPAILGLASLSYLWITQKTFPLNINKKKILFLLLAFGYALLSSLWSPNSEFSIERIIKLLLIIPIALVFLSLTPTLKLHTLRPIFAPLIITIIIAGGFLVFETFTNHSITRPLINYPIKHAHLNRSFIVFTFMVLVGIFLCLNTHQDKIKKALYVTALTGFGLGVLYFSDSQTAQLSFLCGAFFLFLFPFKSNLILKLFFGVLILVKLTLPLTLPLAINTVNSNISEETMRDQDRIIQKASTKARFNVWESTIIEIKKKPLLGHGIEAQRFIKSDHLSKHFKTKNQTLHAHNVILQVWLEFGLIGILFGCIFLFYIYQKIRDEQDTENRRLYITLFSTILCCTMTGYGIWQSWHIGLFFTFTALALIISNNRHKI